MNREEIEDKVRSIISSHLEVEKDLVRSDSALSTEMGMDSLDVLEVAFLLEKEFAIDIRYKSFGEVNLTVAKIVEIVEKSLNEKNSSHIRF